MYTTMLELAISMVFLFLMLSAASSAIPTETPKDKPRREDKVGIIWIPGVGLSATWRDVA